MRSPLGGGDRAMRIIWIATAIIAFVAFPAAHASDRDLVCSAYGEADAIYEKRIASLKPRGILASVSERLIGASEKIKVSRQDALFDRLQSYKAVYKGPRGIKHEHTMLLMLEDAQLCSLERFMLPLKESLLEHGIELDAGEQEQGEGDGLASILKSLDLLEGESGQ